MIHLFKKMENYFYNISSKIPEIFYFYSNNNNDNNNKEETTPSSLSTSLALKLDEFINSESNECYIFSSIVSSILLIISFLLAYIFVSIFQFSNSRKKIIIIILY